MRRFGVSPRFASTERSTSMLKFEQILAPTSPLTGAYFSSSGNAPRGRAIINHSLFFCLRISYRLLARETFLLVVHHKCHPRRALTKPSARSVRVVLRAVEVTPNRAGQCRHESEDRKIPRKLASSPLLSHPVSFGPTSSHLAPSLSLPLLLVDEYGSASRRE